MGGRRLKPKVHADFLSRIMQANALEALEELIWNAFDERATQVEIQIDRNELQGVDGIKVVDNGTSLPFARAAEKFESLGNSDKVHRQLETGVRLHGRLGQGRHKALAIGNQCTWAFTYRKSKAGLFTYQVEGTAGRSDPFYLLDEHPAPRGGRHGCVVSIGQISRSHHNLLLEESRRSLAAKFAPFLMAHSDRQLIYDGHPINPKDAIASRKRLKTIFADHEGQRYSLSGEVIHWAEGHHHREAFLCGESRVPLHRLADGFLPQWCDGTVFITSSMFDHLHQENLLQTVETSADADRAAVVTAIRSNVRKYFLRRRRVAAKNVLEELKTEGSYPYMRPPRTDVDKIERNVFDLCALSISRHLPTFHEGMDVDARTLMLRVIREAIGQNPSAVGKIIREVVKLPAADAKQFAAVLEDVPLSRIVNASHLIARRLEFLKTFRAITLLDPFERTIKERTELHRVLHQNTWIFGEEYHLGTSDEDFKHVLMKHIAILGRDHLHADTSEASLRRLLTDWNKSKEKTPTSLARIPDLMLYRQFKDRRPDQYEFLVIEIKRPGVAIGRKEYNQVQDYALAVSQTEWADKDKSKWVFVAVSDTLSPEIDELTRQRNLPRYTTYESLDGKYEIRAMPWSVIIQGAEGRHEHLRQWLDHSVPLETALERSASVFKELLPHSKNAKGAPGSR